MSSVRAYGEQRDLTFFLYERHLAEKCFAAQCRAQDMGITADILTRDSQGSSSYWDIVQDSLADLVRVQLERCFDKENHEELYEHCRGLKGQLWLCAFPNLFITIAPAEWKFPLPYFLEAYKQCLFAGAYFMALHMYYLVMCVWKFLCNRNGHKFFKVLEWCIKTEYQGRLSPHWHIAAWVIAPGLIWLLQGRTGTAVVSAFVRFLSILLMAEIDVQVGNGRLNYINGYIAKDHDSVDVGLGEYVQKNVNAPWLATYRLLSKSSPGIPEVAIRLAQLPEFERSYSHVLLYPPQPVDMQTLEGRQKNFSSRMYGLYLQEARDGNSAGVALQESFLVWHRKREYDKQTSGVRFRMGGRHQQRHEKTLVTACRYWYELHDGFWGQFALTQLPHFEAKDLLPSRKQYLESQINLVGVLDYLKYWLWSDTDGEVRDVGGFFQVSALPLMVDDSGNCQRLPGTPSPGELVFQDESAAFEYLLAIASRDLEYRGFREDRVATFQYKHRANYLLLSRVSTCENPHAYEAMRQEWDQMNRPKYRDMVWSPEQQEAINLVKQGVSYEDEISRSNSRRWLYIPGPPGSGKSAVLLHLAVWASQFMEVLIICPTGYLVHQYKSRLPDREGVERIRVDTIHGVLNYKRKGADSKVVWTPPSALRKIDLILADEGSQYSDEEWERLFSVIREQPHQPFTSVVADFKQLQPVVSGGSCERFCQQMQTVELKTVYRTADSEHLIFLNSIREKQPTRGDLEEYFGARHWKKSKGLKETCYY
jgi:hypothetical protein